MDGDWEEEKGEGEEEKGEGEEEKGEGEEEKGEGEEAYIFYLQLSTTKIHIENKRNIKKHINYFHKQLKNWNNENR